MMRLAKGGGEIGEIKQKMSHIFNNNYLIYRVFLWFYAPFLDFKKKNVIRNAKAETKINKYSVRMNEFVDCGC